MIQSKTVVNFILNNGKELEFVVAGTLADVMEGMQHSLSGGSEFIERVDNEGLRVFIIRAEDISSVSMYQLDD